MMGAHEKPAARARPASEGAAPAWRPVLLLVDDLPDNLLALEKTLARDDVEIVSAASAGAALEVLLQRDVALALIDVQMPELDGFGLAELMRGVERTRHVPIIFVTAAARDVERLFRGYEAGAVDFLYKPVDPHILRGKVAVFVQLAKQRQKLIEAERMHELFVGILGHDLRSPLTGITLSAQMALPHVEHDKAREQLQRILKNSHRMSRLIHQVLDLTRARLGGGITLYPIEADLKSVVEQVLDESAQHQERVRVEVAGQTQGKWDVDRLLQVAANLIGNALAHGEEGSAVTVRIDGTDAAVVELRVHNRGPAIPAELREVIFEPFRGRTRSDGLGLGLYVVRQIVVAHGGEIACDSSEDAGTRFTVRLPRYVAARREAAVDAGGP